MKILVTGAAGFIGAFTAQRLLDRGDEVIGIDNLNDYYDVQLKLDRLSQLEHQPGFSFVKLDVADRASLAALIRQERPQRVVHLAAQAGVRYSLENPHAYVDANIVGFLNVLECLREHGTEHLVFASTSSVYGSSTKMPFSEHDHADHPVSLYAATKKSNELMAHAYSHLFGIPCTGLRFFTVYGPWGRPDMALFTFARQMLAGEPIKVFNYGNHTRDFTHVRDVAEGVVRTLDRPAQPDRQWSAADPDPQRSHAPYRLYNIGSNEPVKLDRCIELLEQMLGVKAIRELLPLQAGDVADTFADVSDLMREVGYKPETRFEDGLAEFVEWYLEYYGHGSKRETLLGNRI
jgi:UDP-glucuronate 4-epimerase